MSKLTICDHIKYVKRIGWKIKGLPFFCLITSFPYFFNPLTRRQIFESSKLKEFADNNFKFSKWVENTVGKGEIVCYEQFLLPTVFSKGLFPRGVKRCHCVGMG